MASSLAKEARSTSVVGSSRTYSYGRSGEDKCGKNCHNYGEFEHMARNCRNRGMGNRIGEGRRLEYGQGDNGQCNLNGEEDLIVLD